MASSLSVRRAISPINQRLTIMRNYSSSAPSYKETKRRVLDVDINYIETLGSSQNAPPIFFLPGAFGSIDMDFKPILPFLNKEKYKWIAWDPPGHGGSRPPKREYCSKRYECVYALDVDYVKEMLNMLGYQRYTLLCWSGAGITGISIASEQPEKVSGLITWGSFGNSPAVIVEPVLGMKKLGLDAIPAKRRAQLVDMYGEAYLREMWSGWCDEAVRMTSSDGFKTGGSFERTISKVQCPSLVIQGLKDSLITIMQAEHLVEHLGKSGKSTLYTMENGTHNLHLRETKEFVKCIEDFVDRTALRSKI